MRPFRIVAALFLLTCFMCLAPLAPVAADDLFPNAKWPVASSPEAENCSSAGFDAYESWLETKVVTGPGTNPFGTIVIRHGKVVYQNYGGGGGPAFTNDVGSIRKAITTSIIGIAVDENRVTPNTIAYTRWPSIFTLTNQPKDQTIELRHLASMQSGWLTAVGPGVQWLYSNAGSTAAGCVIGATYANEYRSRWPRYGTGQNYIAPMVEDRVRDVIGASWRCTHSSAVFRPIPKTYNTGPKLIVESTVADLARYGYLWLRDGRWKNKQVISRPFVREATRNQSAALLRNYGYFWFTNDNRMMLPAAPADAFWHCGDGADGHRTILLVVPSLDLVAATTVHKNDWNLTYRFTAQPANGPAEWAAALLPAILPDPVGTPKATFVSEFFRDGSTGAFDPTTGRADITPTPAGLDLTGDPSILRLGRRTYSDQSVFVSVDAGMPVGARAGVLLRGAKAGAHFNNADPHVYVTAERRVGDGASIVLVRQGTTVLTTTAVQRTDFATKAFLLKIVTAGPRLRAWVNGEKVVDLANVPNRAGGGYTYLDGRVDPNRPGRVRIEYLITRAVGEGIVDVSFDRRDRCFLTFVEDGFGSALQPNTFFFTLGTERMDFNKFWGNVFSALSGRWWPYGTGTDHLAVELRYPFPHGLGIALEYKNDTELEYVRH